MTIDFDKFLLIDIPFKHDFSTIQNFKDHNVERQYLIFWWIPSDYILCVWQQYDLKRFCYDAIYYFIKVFQLFDYPWSQVLFLFLQLLSLLLLLDLFLLRGFFWNLLINCRWSDYYFFSFEIEILFVKGELSGLLYLFFLFQSVVRNNLLRFICFGNLFFLLGGGNNLNLRSFILNLFRRFLQQATSQCNQKTYCQYPNCYFHLNELININSKIEIFSSKIKMSFGQLFTIPIQMECANRFYNNLQNTKMAYKEQSNNFRKAIRRSQLDELFMAKRLKLMEDSGDKMEDEQSVILKKQDLTEINLKNIASISTTINGIEVLYSAGYPQPIVKFLKSEYLHSQEQFYASFILCNLAVRLKNNPSEELILNVLELLEEAKDFRTIDNLVTFLINLIDQSPQLKQQLIVQYSIVQRIIGLFSRLQNPSLQICSIIVSCISHILNNSDPKPVFKKFRSLLIRFLSITPKQQAIKLMKQATFALTLFTRLFPKQATDYIVKANVFSNLNLMFTQFKDTKLLIFTIKLLIACIGQMHKNDFKIIFTLIFQKLSIFSPVIASEKLIDIRILKIETIKLVSTGLQLQKLLVQNLMQSQLGQGMIESFLVQDDRQIRKQLMFLFTNIYFNTKQANLKQMIQRGMARIRELQSDCFETISHINMLQSYFGK